MSAMTSDSALRVVVAGGGVAGLEALLALRDLAGERVQLTLIEPADEFRFRPMATAEAFGRGHGQHIPMRQLANEMDAQLVRAGLAGVDDERRVALVDEGDPVPYDALLVAVGARAEPAFGGAMTWTPESDPELFGGLRRDIEEGYAKSVAFVVPASVLWALPAYELALMTAWAAESMGQGDVEVSVITPEDAPLGLFGPEGSQAVREDLDEAGIRVETGAYVTEAEGSWVIQPGNRKLEAARVVALPEALGPQLGGVAGDERGFIRVDRHCKVEGAERVWAAGDAVEFPIKQGGIAAQQADAAAEAIAALAGAPVEPKPFQPVLRGILLTGRGREWLRSKLAGGAGEAEAERRALWWPPTKVAGRYLAPYLHRLAGGEEADAEPSGQLVEHELDVETL
jgi:sulfide:quinone oxidoreductase